MAIPFHRPLLCPILLGRSAQCSALEQALDQARAGSGPTVVISGEAGIGKSRLIAEARTRAEERGFLSLEGHCFEPDRDLPYAPVLDLMHRWLADVSVRQLEEALGPTARELVKLLPELTTRLPDLEPTAPLDPEQEKRRLFRALGEFLTGLADQHPLLVIMEDLHWSDDVSLEFILFLARQVARDPILLLLSLRSDETHPTLPHVLAELERERLATDLVLKPLAANDVDAMIQSIFQLDRTIRRGFLDAIYDRTEGNPFFIEEVLRSLVATGDILLANGGWDRNPLDELRTPRTLRDAVQRRAATLSADARHTLALAAVIGRRFDFTLLQRLTRRDEEALLEQLKELIRAQLILEESPDRFVFRHALARGAIYADLLGHERKRLHRAVADALQEAAAEGHASVSSGPVLAELAYHYYEAGTWPQAMAYGQRAGEQATLFHAPRAAVTQFSRALAAAREASLAPPPELYRARGQAYETMGEFEPARADYETALRLARQMHEQSLIWGVLLDLGLLWASRDYAQAGDYYRQALDVARAVDDPPGLGNCLNRIGNWYVNNGQAAKALDYHQEAFAIFEARGDRRGLAETLDLLATTAFLRGDLPQAALHYERAATLFRELDDRRGLASSLTNLAACGGIYTTDTVSPATLAMDEVLRHGELALSAARAIGWRAGEAYALFLPGFVLGSRGLYGRALDRMLRGLAIADEIEHRLWMTLGRCGLGALYLDLLALPAARDYLEQALELAQAIGSRFWLDNATAFMAAASIACGDVDRAEALLAGSTDLRRAPETRAQRMLWCVSAELAVAQGHGARALTIVDRLDAAAASHTRGGVVARLAKIRGQALALLGRADEAEGALQLAREAAARQGARPLLWRIDLALGKIYAVQRRHQEAERASLAARAVVEDLAQEVPDEAVRTSFLHQAVAWLPPSRRRTPERAAREAFGGLTAREREVAVLIARAQTNRQIAEALAITERTAERHVENIRGKLGFNSRLQIAAWAIEQGLSAGSR